MESSSNQFKKICKSTGDFPTETMSVIGNSRRKSRVNNDNNSKSENTIIITKDEINSINQSQPTKSNECNLNEGLDTSSRTRISGRNKKSNLEELHGGCANAITQILEDYQDNGNTSGRVENTNEKSTFKKSALISISSRRRFFNKSSTQNNKKIFTSDPRPTLSNDELHAITDGNSNYNPRKIAKIFSEKTNIKTIGKSIFTVYRGFLLKKLDEQDCKVLIRSLLPEDIDDQISDSFLNEVIKSIKTSPYIQLDEKELISRDSRIAFTNGLFSVKKYKFVEPKKNEYYFSYIDAAFDPDNTQYGHEFEKYLDFITNGDEKEKMLILEVLGYILSPSNLAKKFFIFYGQPDSGKSTFGNLIQELIGVKNCCSIELQLLSENFMVAELFGRQVCINMDIPSTPIKNTANIKQLTGNDRIKGERKFSHPFYFTNTCKLVYGCNVLPQVSSNEYEKAFFNRMIIIPFLRSVPKEKKDNNLIKKLMNEKNYIIKKALEAYKRLLDNNYVFTECKASEKIKRMYIQEGDNVSEFVSECCYINSDASEYTSDLYASYKEFCINSGYTGNTILNKSSFSKSLCRIDNVEAGRWRQGDENRRGFRGICLLKQD